jgi:hypothetical protein
MIMPPFFLQPGVMFARVDVRDLAAGQASFDELIDTPSAFTKIVLRP